MANEPSLWAGSSLPSQQLKDYGARSGLDLASTRTMALPQGGPDLSGMSSLAGMGSPVMGMIGGGVQAFSGLAQTGMSIAAAFDDPGWEAGILPHEFQIGLVRMVNDRLNYNQQSLGTLQNLYRTYDDRLRIAESWARGQIPSSAAMRQMTGTAVNIAQLTGASAEDLIKGGYLTEGEASTLKQVQDIASQGTNYRGDAVTENKIQEQKRQLQQELSRQGIPLAQQQIALQQFENTAAQQRQQAAQAQLGNLTGYLNTASGLRQTNFGQTQNALGMLNNQIGAGNQAYANYLGLGQQRYGIGLGNIQAQNSLYNQSMQTYQGFSQFGLNDETRALVQAGVIGPGTGYQQTGIPLQFAHDVADRVADKNITAYRPGIQQFDRISNQEGVAPVVRWGQADTALLGVPSRPGSSGYSINRFVDPRRV